MLACIFEGSVCGGRACFHAILVIAVNHTLNGCNTPLDALYIFNDSLFAVFLVVVPEYLLFGAYYIYNVAVVVIGEAAALFFHGGFYVSLLLLFCGCFVGICAYGSIGVVLECPFFRYIPFTALLFYSYLIGVERAFLLMKIWIVTAVIAAARADGCSKDCQW